MSKPPPPKAGCWSQSSISYLEFPDGSYKDIDFTKLQTGERALGDYSPEKIVYLTDLAKFDNTTGTWAKAWGIYRECQTLTIVLYVIAMYLYLIFGSYHCSGWLPQPQSKPKDMQHYVQPRSSNPGAWLHQPSVASRIHVDKSIKFIKDQGLKVSWPAMGAHSF